MDHDAAGGKQAAGTVQGRNACSLTFFLAPQTIALWLRVGLHRSGTGWRGCPLTRGCIMINLDSDEDSRLPVQCCCRLQGLLPAIVVSTLRARKGTLATSELYQTRRNSRWDDVWSEAGQA